MRIKHRKQFKRWTFYHQFEISFLCHVKLTSMIPWIIIQFYTEKGKTHVVFNRFNFLIDRGCRSIWMSCCVCETFTLFVMNLKNWKTTKDSSFNRQKRSENFIFTWKNFFFVPWSFYCVFKTCRFWCDTSLTQLHCHSFFWIEQVVFPENIDDDLHQLWTTMCQNMLWWWLNFVVREMIT